MTLSGSWWAPVLTLLTLAGALGAIFETSQRTTFVVITGIVVGASLALFAAQRIWKRPLDWRLSAPLLLGVTALAAEAPRPNALQMAAVFAILAAFSYFLGRRERRLAAAAEASSSASLQFMAALLAVLGVSAGTYAAPVLLIAVTIWLMVWMPSSTRRVHDQETLRVARGPDEVSAYLLDQRHLPLWYPGYLSSDLHDGKELGVGSIFRQVVQPRGRAVEAYVKIDEYEPGHRLCSHVLQVPGQGHGCYSFALDGQGTLATYDFDVEQPYPIALVGSRWFVGEALRKMRAQRHQAFEKLKSILEA